MSINLSIDEALLKINTTSFKLNAEKRLDLRYQDYECYSCQTRQLQPVNQKNDATTSLEFILSAKNPLKLELWELSKAEPAATPARICKLEHIQLNNQAKYELEAVDRNRLPLEIDCSLRNLDPGESYWLPIALILSFLLLISAAECLFLVCCKRRSAYKTNQAQEDGAGEQVGSEVTGSQLELAHGEPQSKAEKPTRFEALDVFRGLAISGMIVVNYGGAGYTFLEHKAWNGLTLADLVFPFFIYSMGASIAISTRSQLISRNRPLGLVLVDVLRRAAILMVLGLCLNSVGLNSDRGLGQLRLMGVLQRFAISYLAVALIYTLEASLLIWIYAKRDVRAAHQTGSRSRSLLTGCLTRGASWLLEGGLGLTCLCLYLYFSLIFQYDYTCPAGYLGPGGDTERSRFSNCTGGAANWIDNWILGQSHLYNDSSLHETFYTNIAHDPEGLLGCTTSILLTLFGLQSGKIMLSQFKDSDRNDMNRKRLVNFAELILVLGLVTFPSILLVPVNKKLWSLSFVCLVGTIASLTLAFIHLVLDIFEIPRFALIRLLSFAGKNSLFLYVAHSLASHMLPWHFPVRESSHMELALRLTWTTFVWLLVAKLLASKKIFIRV